MTQKKDPHRREPEAGKQNLLHWYYTRNGGKSQVKTKIRYKSCKKCGRAIRHSAYCGFGFRSHPLCYAEIYGWGRD